MIFGSTLGSGAVRMHHCSLMADCNSNEATSHCRRHATPLRAPHSKVILFHFKFKLKLRIAAAPLLYARLPIPVCARARIARDGQPPHHSPWVGLQVIPAPGIMLYGAFVCGTCVQNIYVHIAYIGGTEQIPSAAVDDAPVVIHTTGYIRHTHTHTERERERERRERERERERDRLS